MSAEHHGFLDRYSEYLEIQLRDMAVGRAEQLVDYLRQGDEAGVEGSYEEVQRLKGLPRQVRNLVGTLKKGLEGLGIGHDVDPLEVFPELRPTPLPEFFLVQGVPLEVKPLDHLPVEHGPELPAEVVPPVPEVLPVDVPIRATVSEGEPRPIVDLLPTPDVPGFTVTQPAAPEIKRLRTDLSEARERMLRARAALDHEQNDYLFPGQEITVPLLEALYPDAPKGKLATYKSAAKDLIAGTARKLEDQRGVKEDELPPFMRAATEDLKIMYPEVYGHLRVEDFAKVVTRSVTVAQLKKKEASRRSNHAFLKTN